MILLSQRSSVTLSRDVSDDGDGGRCGSRESSKKSLADPGSRTRKKREDGSVCCDRDASDRAEGNRRTNG